MKIYVSISYFIGALILFVLFNLPISVSAQNIDFGKSYINVSKGMTGGTVEPGDTLEIRASVVVKAGTYDSCGYQDIVPAGTSYIPGTIRVLTNEGKIYKQFTDVANDDQGWISGSNVTINLGFNGASAPASAFRRGRIVNTFKPSFYGGTCIMIASFRVKVTAAYNTTISIGGGSISYKPLAGLLTTYTFPGRLIQVYNNYGICSNTVGTNSIGTEFNGTFGTGKPRNRGASGNVPAGYTYNTFTSNTPNDYYYGVSNNTSINTGYTTLNNWPKPDNTHRVFGVWDIIGDHTGAVSPLLGNPAADTVNNPNAGYMLVINAAYRIDSAFQQTITGLCPNTYYEISCWLRNICSKCGCDSNGTGATSVGYIPTAANDSSGVYPNLSFGVNGIDYYTTGNVLYTGQWIKKGFTFLTGPAQTSFTIKFYNNAPGGGGNDWALDDISVATCSPNLSFNPSNNPKFCKGNAVDIGAYVRSFFNNYIYYKWQKSLDNGLTWVDAGTSGTGSPTWNGTAWEYYTTYPSFIGNSSDSGTKFKVVVASTSANLSDPNCSFSDATSILTLDIMNCGVPLSTSIISFTGKIDPDNQVRLNWTTNEENGPIKYIIERSSDGRTFNQVGIVNGYNIQNELNQYAWSETYVSQFAFYRIRLSENGMEKVSRTIKLFVGEASIEFSNILNPFKNNLTAFVNTSEPQIIYFQLIDNFGNVVRRQQFALTDGINKIEINHTETLACGLYTLQIQSSDKIINKRVLKQ